MKNLTGYNLQQKESMDELLNERRQSFEAVIEMEDQDLILMKNERILSQRVNLMNLINVIDEEQMQENINADDETRIALEEGLQSDNKAKCIEEEGHLLKDVKKEEVCAKDLAKGERTSDDWSLTMEGFAEDEQSFEAVKSMEEYLSEDEYSEVTKDGECLLHGKNNELLQQKEFSNTLMFEAVTNQEQFLVKEGDENQSEELICEATVEIVEPSNFQIDNLCVNAGIISDDEILMNCHREIELLEYLLENSEYDSVIADGGVHYSGQEQKDIIEADGVEEKLVDNFESPLEDSLKRLNQHTDVMIKKEKSEQHTKMLPKE